MKCSKTLVLVVTAIITGAILTAGVGVAVTAGASSTNHRYSGCVINGQIYEVGTGSLPSCPNGTVISWNSQGPQGVAGPRGATGAKGATGAQGATGPQGLSSAQYQGENAWAESVTAGTDTPFPVASISSGKSLIITGIEASNLNATCSLQGSFDGNTVTYYFSQTGNSGPVIPVVSGLQWPLDSTGSATVNCAGGPTTVTVTGYLT
jgi:hypothetical protein